MSARGVFAVLAIALTASLPCAAQPAGERVDPFLLAGALGLEADIEACNIPASDSDKEALKQAIRIMQQKIEMPDAVIAKIRQDMRTFRSETDWKSQEAAQYCRDLKASFNAHLADVLSRSK